tara:strand:- start:1236 stop:2180 length:945 start_codon:yes stop_codon:yes gene_type:complete
MDKIKDQLKHCLSEFDIDNFGEKYRGKVRDNFHFEDKIAMVTSDRVSAFDHVLGTIPFKGQILTEIANFWFEKTSDIVRNHIISKPDPQVMIVEKASPLPIEIIIRGYITGSLWRDYCDGKGNQYGFELPKDLKKNQKFDTPIVTPTTKEEYGLHDQPISKEEIIKQDYVSRDVYELAEQYSLDLFKRGQDWANKQGLILVDTKYEFGLIGDELIVIDEIHTPDSSRYWVKDGYLERYENNEDQKMLDKENIRKWLIDRGFSGEGTPPELSDEIRIFLTEQYISLYKKITGKDFEPAIGDVKSRILENLKSENF